MPRYDTDDDDTILKDGAKLAVPLHLMDAGPNGSASRVRFSDVYPARPGGHTAFAGHRPGWAASSLIDTQAADEREAAWQAVGARNREAWRQPPPAPTERPSQATGRPAQRQDAYRPTDPPRDTSRVPTGSPGVIDHAARADADRAYEERAEQLRNAWRG